MSLLLVPFCWSSQASWVGVSRIMRGLSPGVVFFLAAALAVSVVKGFRPVVFGLGLLMVSFFIRLSLRSRERGVL